MFQVEDYPWEAPGEENMDRILVMWISGADFTPTATGLDVGGNKSAIYNPFGLEYPSSIVWTCAEIWFRVETLPSSGVVTLQIARYTGTGTFALSNYLNTTPLSIASSASSHEVAVGPGSGIDMPTVNSNDKLCASYPALASGATGFSVRLTLTASF